MVLQKVYHLLPIVLTLDSTDPWSQWCRGLRHFEKAVDGDTKGGVIQLVNSAPGMHLLRAVYQLARATATAMGSDRVLADVMSAAYLHCLRKQSVTLHDGRLVSLSAVPTEPLPASELMHLMLRAVAEERFAVHLRTLAELWRTLIRPLTHPPSSAAPPEPAAVSAVVCKAVEEGVHNKLRGNTSLLRWDVQRRMGSVSAVTAQTPAATAPTEPSTPDDDDVYEDVKAVRIHYK